MAFSLDTANYKRTNEPWRKGSDDARTGPQTVCDVKSPCMNVFTNTFMAGLIAMAWATPWKSMSFDPSPAAVLL